MDPRDTSDKTHDTSYTFGGMPLRDPTTFTRAEIERINDAGNRMFLALAATLLTWSPAEVGKVNILEHAPTEIMKHPWYTIALEHGTTNPPNVGPFGVPWLPAVQIVMELPRDLRPWAIKRLILLVRSFSQSPTCIWRAVQGVIQYSGF